MDTATIPATRLLAYTITHDQVGNRAVGDRPSQNLDFGQLAVRPHLRSDRPTPQCFSWARNGGRRAPFQFFSSHPEPELARATAEGRKAEFAEHGWDADEIPDPQDPETFRRSKLNWDEIDDGDHGRLRAASTDELIALRHNEPDLADPWLDHLGVDYDEEPRVDRLHRGAFAIACNLGTEAVTVPVTGEVVLAWGEPTVAAEGTQLAGHSFAILRESVKSPSTARPAVDN